MIIEKYAILQITRFELRFEVLKYRLFNTPQGITKKPLKVIYKHREKGVFLTSDGIVIDHKSTARKLRNIIDKYELSFSTKVENVILVLPPNNLRINNTSASRTLGDSNPGIVTNEVLKELNKDFYNTTFGRDEKVIAIRPISYLIDDQRTSRFKPVNTLAYKIIVNASVYYLPSALVKSHEDVVGSAKLNVLNLIVQPYALANAVIDEKKFNEQINVMINWDYDDISISFFSRGTLTYYKSLNLGLNNMIEATANRLNAKTHKIYNYIFNLIDFKTSATDDTIIYRKYNKQNRMSIEYTAGQFKDLINAYIYEVIDKIDFYVEQELKIHVNHPISIYHVGKITNISGFDILLKRSNSAKNHFVHFSKITGANEIWTSALTGAGMAAHIINKTLQIKRFSEPSNYLAYNQNSQNREFKQPSIPTPQTRQQSVYQQTINLNPQIPNQNMSFNPNGVPNPNIPFNQGVMQNPNINLNPQIPNPGNYMPNSRVRPGAYNANIQGLDPSRPIVEQLQQKKIVNQFPQQNMAFDYQMQPNFQNKINKY